VNWFTPPPAKIKVIGNEFGLPMTREQMSAALIGRHDSELCRAMGQLLMALRERCVVQADAYSVSEKPQAAAYQLGGANACLSLVSIMQSLQKGEMPDEVKEWFEESRKD